jgi:hypothetical protein
MMGAETITPGQAVLLSTAKIPGSQGNCGDGISCRVASGIRCKSAGVVPA